MASFLRFLRVPRVFLSTMTVKELSSYTEYHKEHALQVDESRKKRALHLYPPFYKRKTSASAECAAHLPPVARSGECRR